MTAPHEIPALDPSAREVRSMEQLAALTVEWKALALRQVCREVLDTLLDAGCPRERLVDVAAPAVAKAYALVEQNLCSHVARIERELTNAPQH